jgi:hypothetical protein
VTDAQRFTVEMRAEIFVGIHINNSLLSSYFNQNLNVYQIVVKSATPNSLKILSAIHVLIYVDIWTDKRDTPSGYTLVSSLNAAVQKRQKFISDTNPIPNNKQYSNFHIHNMYLIAKPLEQHTFALCFPRSFLHCNDADGMIHSMLISH